MNNLGDLLKLIKYPSLTEKSINLYGDRQYTFIVDRTLTKTQIKFVIESIFDGVTTAQLDELSAETSMSLSTENPDYGMLAGRIAISNHQK